MNIPIMIKPIKVHGETFYLSLHRDENNSIIAALQRVDHSEDTAPRQLDLDALLLDWEAVEDWGDNLPDAIERALNKTKIQCAIEDHRLGALEGVLDDIDHLARWAMLGVQLAEDIERASMRGASQAHGKTLAQVDVAMQDYREASGATIPGEPRPIPWLDEGIDTSEIPECDEEWFKRAKLVRP